MPPGTLRILVSSPLPAPLEPDRTSWSQLMGGTPAAWPSQGPRGSPGTFENLCEDVSRHVLPLLQGLPAALDPVLADLTQETHALPDLAKLLPLPRHKLNESSSSAWWTEHTLSLSPVPPTPKRLQKSTAAPASWEGGRM